MTILIEDLKAGDVLYDVYREKAGNTTMSREAYARVYVEDVGTDEHGPWALLAWNGNKPRRKTRGSTKYKRCPKEWLKLDIFGPRSCCLCGRTEGGGHSDDCDHPAVMRRRAAEAKRAEQERKQAERAAKKAERERLRVEKTAIAATRGTKSDAPILHYRPALGGLAWVTTKSGKVVMLPERYYDTLPGAALAAGAAGIAVGLRSSAPGVTLPIAGIGGQP